jgi:putative tricarboxylic transport membrane protein
MACRFIGRPDESMSLALGVPGSPTTTVMLAGFMMWGIMPGPLLFQNNADLVCGLISSKFIGNYLLLLMNIFLIPLFIWILRIPYTILMGFIVIFASIGAFTTNNNVFDIWMVMGFGVLGYIMNKLKYPIVPLVLALVLGRMIAGVSIWPRSLPRAVKNLRYRRRGR